MVLYIYSAVWPPALVRSISKLKHPEHQLLLLAPNIPPAYLACPPTSRYFLNLNFNSDEATFIHFVCLQFLNLDTFQSLFHTSSPEQIHCYPRPCLHFRSTRKSPLSTSKTLSPFLCQTRGSSPYTSSNRCSPGLTQK